MANVFIGILCNKTQFQTLPGLILIFLYVIIEMQADDPCGASTKKSNGVMVLHIQVHITGVSYQCGSFVTYFISHSYVTQAEYLGLR